MINSLSLRISKAVNKMYEVRNSKSSDFLHLFKLSGLSNNALVGKTIKNADLRGADLRSLDLSGTKFINPQIDEKTQFSKLVGEVDADILENEQIMHHAFSEHAGLKNFAKLFSIGQYVYWYPENTNFDEPVEQKFTTGIINLTSEIQHKKAKFDILYPIAPFENREETSFIKGMVYFSREYAYFVGTRTGTYAPFFMVMENSLSSKECGGILLATNSANKFFSSRLLVSPYLGKEPNSDILSARFSSVKLPDLTTDHLQTLLNFSSNSSKKEERQSQSIHKL